MTEAKTCRICGVELTEENCYLSYYKRGICTCSSCGNKYKMTWRDSNRVRSRAIVTKCRTNLRKEVLSAYGGYCACCGEDTPEFLVVDHTRGDGASHRRELGTRDSNRVYAEIKRKGFPKERFQLLCANCNHAKGQNKTCPHARLSISALVQEGRRL